MKLRLNGEDHETGEGQTLAGLLAGLGVSPLKVAVEKNRDIVPKAAYGSTVLAEGDVIEIVQFVGGG